MPPDPNHVIEDYINPNYAHHHGLPYKGKVNNEVGWYADQEVDSDKSVYLPVCLYFVSFRSKSFWSSYL